MGDPIRMIYRVTPRWWCNWECLSIFKPPCYCIHPLLLWKKLKAPIAILRAEIDQISPPALLKWFEEILDARPESGWPMASASVKAMKKLSVTVSKFDELHHMSEDLLSEFENFQSQLQERDSGISFFWQEMTRCTNDFLSASKMTKEKSSAELHELLTWLDSLCSQVLRRDVQIGDSNGQGQEYKERLQKDIASLVSELESLRIVAQSKDVLLNAERDRVKELLLRKEALEVSLHQKEMELSVLGDRDSGEAASEIVEVEPLEAARHHNRKAV